MNREKAEELLSRAIDGELTPTEVNLLAEYRRSHPELDEVEAAWREAGRHLSEPVALPVTPEAAWQDVRRRIRLARDVEEDRRAPVFGWRLRWAASIMVLTLLVLSGVAVLQLRRGTAPALAHEAEQGTQVEFVETDLPGASPMVYEDAETGWVVIWVAGVEDEIRDSRFEI
jgi:anti-sigma factor RsiW